MPTGVYERTPEMKTGKHMLGRVPHNKGKKLTDNERLKRSGANNSGWKGGISLAENRKPYTDSYNHEYRIKLRKRTIDIMGGKCVKCGFNDQRALQIDHINGGGNRERKEKKFLGQGNTYHKQVIDSFTKNEGKYQLLCANCNWIKRSENNELKSYLQTKCL